MRILVLLIREKVQKGIFLYLYLIRLLTSFRISYPRAKDLPPTTMGVVKETKQPGDGKTYPQQGDKLTMHYQYVQLCGKSRKNVRRNTHNSHTHSGTLAANGQKFDASRDRGRPFQFTIGIGQVIRGWDEGVSQMSLGESATLRITSDYGYGARGAGGVIPPHADLVFDVELLAINDHTA